MLIRIQLIGLQPHSSIMNDSYEQISFFILKLKIDFINDRVATHCYININNVLTIIIVKEWYLYS